VVARVLEKAFNDGQWILLSSVGRSSRTTLHKWAGKRVRMTHPIEGNREYMKREGVQLIAATRYHVVIKNQDGKRVIKNCKYTNPEVWELVE
jgi:hypothetical protein